MKRLQNILVGAIVAVSMLVTPVVASAASACSATQIAIALPILTNGSKCIDNNQPGGAIVEYLKGVLKLAGIAAGMVIILMLVIGGIQYLTSFGDPGAIKNAKNRITNAMIALMLFLMMFAILQFLLPGGVLTA